MFYLANIIIVLYNLLTYGIFRQGIYSYLRLSKMSKTNIRKNRKGFLNYWFYSSINKQNPMGVAFYLNILYFGITVLYTVGSVLFGYIAGIRPYLFVLSILVCAIEVPAAFFSGINITKERYGVPFVFLAEGESKGKFYSSLGDILSWLPTVLLIYVTFMRL